MTEFGNIVPDPTGQDGLLDQIMSGDVVTVSPEQAEAEERQLQAKQAEIDEPWCMTNHPGPTVMCRLLPTGWQVSIDDFGQTLTIGQKNQLIKYLTFMLRRHNQRQAYRQTTKIVKSQAQKDAEIRAALQESFKRGELLGV